MTAPHVKRPGGAAAQPGREGDSPGGRIEVKDTYPASRPQWRVTIRGRRVRTWSEYHDAIEAHRVCEQLRRHGIEAHVERIADDLFASRRRFLVWAVLCGFVRPERLTERILAELKDSAP